LRVSQIKRIGEKRLFFVVFHCVIVYIILIVIGVMLSAFILLSSINLHGEGSAIGGGIAGLIWIGYSLVLNSILIYRKKLYKNYWYIVLVIPSILYGLIGMVIAAFLTTRNAQPSTVWDNQE
jgi:hypothetical protein